MLLLISPLIVFLAVFDSASLASTNRSVIESFQFFSLIALPESGLVKRLSSFFSDHLYLFKTLGSGAATR